MKTVKKTKKVFKPAYTVDIRFCETSEDVLVMFALAKAINGMDVTADEFTAHTAVLIDGMDFLKDLFEELIDSCKPVEKKRNFWQRLKYLFTGK